MIKTKESTNIISHVDVNYLTMYLTEKNAGKCFNSAEAGVSEGL